MTKPIKCLISAGPTREWIDSVRFVSNPSSGKMGFELAIAARKMGFEVTLVSGPVALPRPEGIIYRPVETAIQMREVLVDLFPESDLTIMSAAVSDHRPEYLGDKKIKKNKFPENLNLIPNPDILHELGNMKSPNQKLIGFAAESTDHLANGQKKLEAKNLDWIVVNDISKPEIGFESEMNQVTLLSRNNENFSFPLSSKKEIASAILNQVWK
tara:strand:+ start:171 stop:809 length:639 start_codon:yes stop_codon:yes gene_type:complete